MSKFIPIILIAGFISFIATPFIRRLAHTFGFVDKPDQRKIHIEPIPMLGGLAIYIAVILSMLLTGTQPVRELIGVLGGATIVTGFGLWDDRFGMRPMIKMLGQAAAGGLLVWSGIQTDLFAIQFLNIALTLFWVIGISNAMNFQDNMDGLAAGLTAVASSFFFALAVLEGLGLVASLAAALIGASVGFLYYNFNPATLFMGDAGSMLLGFMLAVLGIKLEFVGRVQGVTWMIPVILLGLPIFDTTLVVISRLRNGRRIYQGGKDHTSHRLVVLLKMSQARAVMTLYLIAVVLGLVAVMLRDATQMQARLILTELILLFIAALLWLESRFSYEPSSPSLPEEEL